MNALGIIMGNGLRVGLEDNVWYDADRTILATNSSLVQRIVRIASSLDRQIATPVEVRRLLALPEPMVTAP